MQSFKVFQFKKPLENSIRELQELNKQLAKLLVKKEELTKVIVSSLEHNQDGQKTYEYQEWKIEVKTPSVYSLDKKLYQSGEIKIPDAYNPIKESVSYTIDKRLCDKYLEKSPKKVRDALIQLIEKRPGKASVTIKERI